MTAGYDGSESDEESGSKSERLGPLPPRMNSTGSFPTVPVTPPAFSHAGAPGAMAPPPPPYAGPMPAAAVSPAQTGPVSRPISQPPPGVTGPFPAGPYPTGSFPAQPVSGPYPTGSFPAQPVSGPYATSAVPFSAVPQPAPRRGGALAKVAFVLVILLLLVVAGQSYLIYRLNHRVDTANTAAAHNQAADNQRLEGLEGRAKSLEQKTGSSLNTSDVAAAVLPSVFRVETPEALGTAFAIGKAPDGGGTNLLTNNHVVTDYYKTGGRTVALTRDNLRFTATIVKVDPDKDLALLHTDESFPRLVAQTDLPKVGDPVLAIGAPLGLSDSVTSGVISAYRDTTDGQRLQFDAPINPGNSGGPVVNSKKNVVGIATAKAQDAEGIGLAIPIKVACDTFSVC
jgi:putative serine protease PepD